METYGECIESLPCSNFVILEWENTLYRLLFSERYSFFLYSFLSPLFFYSFLFFTISHIVMLQVSEILESLAQYNGKPTSAIKELFTHHLSNIICSFAFGHRYFLVLDLFLFNYNYY